MGAIQNKFLAKDLKGVGPNTCSYKPSLVNTFKYQEIFLFLFDYFLVLCKIIAVKEEFSSLKPNILHEPENLKPDLIKSTNKITHVPKCQH